MKKISSSTKTIIESLECPKHKKHPEVSMDEKGQVNIVCCCHEFQSVCLYIVNKDFKIKLH